MKKVNLILNKHSKNGPCLRRKYEKVLFVDFCFSFSLIRFFLLFS